MSYPYHDCTCDFFAYGIWNKRNSVALPIEFIKDYHIMLKDVKKNDKKEYLYLKERNFKDKINRLDKDVIFIDFEPKTYIRHNEVSLEDIYML